MRIAIAGDHAGFPLKKVLAAALAAAGHELVDLGTNDPLTPSDYPDFAVLVCDAVKAGKVDRGVLVCGSGVGVSVAANKVPGIRAALCHDAYSAHQGVEHDDMNVLCLGSEVVGPSLAADLVVTFLGARFDGGDRYIERLKKVEAMERAMANG